MKGIVKNSARAVTVKARLGKDPLGHQSDVQITARETSIPGLVVHRDVSADGFPDGEGWSITHEASGLALKAGITSYLTVREVIGRLAELGVDWTKPKQQVGTKANADQFRAILNSVEEG